MSDSHPQSATAEPSAIVRLTTTVSITFVNRPSSEISYHGPDLRRIVEPGRFRLMVGGSSDHVKSVGLDVVRP